MTPDDQRAVVDAAVAQFTAKVQPMPRDRIMEVIDRLVMELMGDAEDEVWACPGCGYPWPGDEA